MSVHNQKAPLLSTSGTGPRMHSNLNIHADAYARNAYPTNAAANHHSRHSRRRIGRLCILRSRDNHHIRGSHRHRIRGSHRITAPG